jgi:hypothetical protein
MADAGLAAAIASIAATATDPPIRLIIRAPCMTVPPASLSELRQKC